MKLALRLAALASVELVRPGTFADLAALLQSAAVAATPAAAPSDRIAVTVMGQGPDVILIPGLASSAHVWDETIAHLKATHRVHVVQVAGFAGAPAGANASGPVLDPVVTAVHDYITARRLKAPAVIGHSLGGLIAMKLAMAHPGDAGRLMIVDSLPFFGAMFGPQASVAAMAPQAAAMRDRLLAGTQESYAAAEPAQMARLIKSHGPQAEAAIVAASASDHRVVAQAIYDDFTTDLRDQVGRIGAPLTMLYPYDASTGMDQARVDGLYRAAFAPVKGAKITRIDGSYHFIMIDQPAAFLAEVDAFLK